MVGVIRAKTKEKKWGVGLGNLVSPGLAGNEKDFSWTQDLKALTPSPPPPPPDPQTCLQRHTAPRPPGPAPGWQTRPWLGSQTWRWSQGSPSRRAHTRQQLQPSRTRGTPGGHWGGGQGQAHGVGHSWAHTCRDRDPLSQGHSRRAVRPSRLTPSLPGCAVVATPWPWSHIDLALNPSTPPSLCMRQHGIVVLSKGSGLEFQA